MTSDLDLLKKFARENSQDAFAEIVRRHLNLIYSAALRQVRSPQLAEEVAQSVFADLARNAGKLNNATGGTPVLTAWLYSVTRRTAIDAIRKESRRQLREQIAVEMNNMTANASDWTQIEPLLDDAMAALDETDRSAILLRYFENKNLREVGEALGASEDAAQKRVSRAVERLREFFSKRNVTIGAGGLAALISANAVQSAPIGLAATISAAAVLAGTTVSTSTAIAATKIIAMTTLQKSIIGAALAVAVGTGIFEAHQDSQLREQVQTLQQQQAPLAEEIRQLQKERDDATNRLAGMAEEIANNQENMIRTSSPDWPKTQAIRTSKSRRC
jgi:RNA polymerase sigma factor (sigma-70 family)